PFSQGGDFHDGGIEGMFRFLKRVWALVATYSVESPETNEAKRMTHKTIKKVTADIASLHYNTAIAALMEYYNFLSKQKTVSFEEAKVFLLLLAPFAPHMTEELYQRIAGKEDSIHTHPWPTYDPKMLEEDEVTIVVQINGKVRDTIRNQRSKIKDQKDVEQLAGESEKVKKYLAGKKIEKVVYVEGKIISFVVSK
ncbi:MAG: class I tRNA ligase family protein, partial [Candidatus Levybacteria bacterium]|nr:class I tRNA ligase family protein [Candidatus Levybacteria bacterium]